MRKIVLAIIAAALPVSVAAAEQSAVQRLARPAAAPAVQPPLKQAANPCAAYGAGFIRIEGSSTCVKSGGSVSVGVGTAGVVR